MLQDRRPYLATECDDLQQAEKWRRQIIGEVSRKVAQIQNGRLWLKWCRQIIGKDFQRGSINKDGNGQINGSSIRYDKLTISRTFDKL